MKLYPSLDADRCARDLTVLEKIAKVGLFLYTVAGAALWTANDSPHSQSQVLWEHTGMGITATGAACVAVGGLLAIAEDRLLRRRESAPPEALPEVSASDLPIPLDQAGEASIVKLPLFRTPILFHSFASLGLV